MNAITRPGLRSFRLLAWLGAGARTVIADARRHRVVFAIFGAIWAMALTRVFIHHTPVLPVMFNWTASLPYRIVLVDHGPRRWCEATSSSTPSMARPRNATTPA
jgi:hypothetical protein